MRIQMRTADRKTVAKALAEFLGTEARYQSVPSCAYQVGAYTIDRNGNIEGEDLEAIRGFLLEQGYIQQEHEDPVVDASVDHLEKVSAINSAHISESGADRIENMEVTIPLDDYTPQTLTNLLKMMYARQNLIAAMTRCKLIWIEEELIDRLNEEKPENIESISKILQDEILAGMVGGVEYSNDKLTMAFPFDEKKPTEWSSYSDLMIAIAKRAKEAKHISEKRLNPEENEMKYCCRNWLMQLGMGGEEYKGQRQTLLGHLTGFAAFRTAEKMEAHKAKLAAKRKKDPIPEVRCYDAE